MELISQLIHFSHQLAVQGSSPGVRAGHAAVNIGTKASYVTNMEHADTSYI